MLIFWPKVCSSFASVVEFVGNLSSYASSSAIILLALSYNEKLEVSAVKIIGQIFCLALLEVNEALETANKTFYTLPFFLKLRRDLCFYQKE